MDSEKALPGLLKPKSENFLNFSRFFQSKQYIFDQSFQELY